MTKIHKRLNLQTLHTCVHHDNYLIKNCSYLFSAQIIYYDVISVPVINKL
jgi:hypothetical protein